MSYCFKQWFTINIIYSYIYFFISINIIIPKSIANIIITNITCGYRNTIINSTIINITTGINTFINIFSF